MTEAEMRARGFSEADIAYTKRLQQIRAVTKGQPIATAGPKQPEPDQKAEQAKSPLEFFLRLLRGQ